MAQPKERGQFAWHDLMTRDTEAAIPFYRDLFGWTIAEVDRGPKVGICRVFRHNDIDLAGIIEMKPDEPMPSHWISYITVDDVDQSSMEAKSAGGTLHVPPLDIPGLGRFCVVADPRGAVFSPFRFAENYEPATSGGPPRHGEFCWHELLSREAAVVGGFYVHMFGWQQRSVSMGELGDYHLFDRNGVEIAGMMQMPAESAGAPSNWLPYLSVNDVDKSAEKIRELGGGIFVEPMEIPEAGRFCVGADPTGSMFATYRKSL